MSSMSMQGLFSRTRSTRQIDRSALPACSIRCALRPLAPRNSSSSRGSRRPDALAVTVEDAVAGLTPAWPRASRAQLEHLQVAAARLQRIPVRSWIAARRDERTRAASAAMAISRALSQVLGRGRRTRARDDLGRAWVVSHTRTR